MIHNKYVLFVLLPTIQDFLSENAKTGVEWTFDALAQFIKDKTGIDLTDTVALSWLERFVTSLLNNSEMFLIMLTMQYTETLAEQMVLNHRGYISSLTQIVRSWIRPVNT